MGLEEDLAAMHWVKRCACGTLVRGPVGETTLVCSTCGETVTVGKYEPVALIPEDQPLDVGVAVEEAEAPALENEPEDEAPCTPGGCGSDLPAA